MRRYGKFFGIMAIGLATMLTLADFAEAHRRRNGFSRPGAPVEVIALRATARLASPVAMDDLPAVARTGVVGSAVIAEPDCTIWVPAGWEAVAHPSGALVLTRSDR